MYKAIRFFRDIQDKSHAYRPGDEFPRPGLEVTPERLEELSTTNNRRGVAVIAEEKPKAEPKAEPKEEAKAEPEAETQEKPKRRKKKNAD